MHEAQTANGTSYTQQALIPARKSPPFSSGDRRVLGSQGQSEDSIASDAVRPEKVELGKNTEEKMTCADWSPCR